MSAKTSWTSRVLNHSDLHVKRDRPLRELVLKVGASAYSDNPLNLFPEGPPSIGKTTSVINIIVPYFPKTDVWLLGGLSPTALVHEYGTLIDSRSGDPIDVDKKPEKENFIVPHKTPDEPAFDKEGYAKAKKEWRETMRNSAYFVDLSRKIMVFLEAPHLETYARLRPILSHDVEEISFKFTDKSETGLRTIHTILRGWPATIFLSVEGAPSAQLATRGLAGSPEMSEDKYHEANKLSGDKTARPWRYSTKNDPELKAIQNHIAKISEASKEVDEVNIPYGDKIGDLFPCRVPADMRHCPHFLSLIKQNALLNMFDRPVISKGKETYLLANLEDLETTIPLYADIVEATSLQVPKHILNFYKNVFLPVQKDVLSLSEDDYDYERITVARLVDKHNRLSSYKISSDTVYVYLKTLKEKALVDSKTDPKDKRHKIYFSLTTQPKNTLDFGGKGLIEFFSEKDFENWLNGEANYLTKMGEDNFLFYASLDDWSKSVNPFNLLSDCLKDENSLLVRSVLVRYFGMATDIDISLKTETEPKNNLPLDSKVI
jgi:DNA-binding PadR family transcriptional regulator